MDWDGFGMIGRYFDICVGVDWCYVGSVMLYFYLGSIGVV